MHKRTARTLSIAVLCITILMPTTAEAHHQDGPCSRTHWRHIYYDQHSTWGVRRVIRCAANRWPVPGSASAAIRIFSCESGLNPRSIGGDNLGVAQHKDDFWPGRARLFLRRWFEGQLPSPYGTRHDRRLAFNARANIIAAIRMAHNARSWQAWSCA